MALRTSCPETSDLQTLQADFERRISNLELQYKPQLADQSAFVKMVEVVDTLMNAHSDDEEPGKTVNPLPVEHRWPYVTVYVEMLDRLGDPRTPVRTPSSQLAAPKSVHHMQELLKGDALGAVFNRILLQAALDAKLAVKKVCVHKHAQSGGCAGLPLTSLLVCFGVLRVL